MSIARFTAPVIRLASRKNGSALLFIALTRCAGWPLFSAVAPPSSVPAHFASLGSEGESHSNKNAWMRLALEHTDKVNGQKATKKQQIVCQDVRHKRRIHQPARRCSDARVQSRV